MKEDGTMQIPKPVTRSLCVANNYQKMSED